MVVLISHGSTHEKFDVWTGPKMSCFCIWRALSKCDAGLFNKLVGIYPELAVHERALDTLIDLFKKDQVPFNDFSSPLSAGELIKRDDSQQRFLAQHSVATLLRHCLEYLQHCSNIATLCCAKNRCCESYRVTSSPLGLVAFIWKVSFWQKPIIRSLHKKTKCAVTLNQPFPVLISF